MRINLSSTFGVSLLAGGIVIVAGACGCSQDPPAPKMAQPPGPVSGPDYFPLTAGTVISFQGGTGIGKGPIDSERQSYDIAAIAAPDGNPGFTINRQGRGLLNAITMTYAVRPDGIVTFAGMFGVSKTEFSPPFLELPATISPGAKWTWSGTSSGSPMTIESVLEGRESITVPAGTFTCLRIRRSFSPGGGSLVQWYAEKVGVIKVEMERPGGRVRLERAN